MTGLLARIGSTLSSSARLRHALEQARAGQIAEVFPVLASAAERGDVTAQFWVGKAYLDGNGVPPSRATAATWLERAATAGNTEAQSVLAAIYLTGAAQADGSQPGLFSDIAGIEPDFAKALHWGQLAAQSGAAEAQALLGYVFSSGPDHLRDQAAGDDWYRRSAESGCPQGCLGHGLALMRDAQEDATKRQAADMIARAAAADLPLGLYLHGVMSENGIGLERDPVKAADLYRRAAERSVRSGQARWGLALMEGRGVARDPVNGETWLRRAPRPRAHPTPPPVGAP